MSNRSQLWNLLMSRVGKWVSRDDLNFLGGEDTGRRMREIRSSLSGSTSFRLDERTDNAGRTEYMLVGINAEDAADDIERRQWVCTGCLNPASRLPQASMDPRWRLAYCRYCHNRRAIYKKAD